MRDLARRFTREVVGPRWLEAFENPPFSRAMTRLADEAGLLRTMTPQ
ncbi:hypothetical protein [Nocardia mangyaensis]